MLITMLLEVELSVLLLLLGSIVVDTVNMSMIRFSINYPGYVYQV